MIARSALECGACEWRSGWARRVLLCLPLIFVGVFLVVPLGADDGDELLGAGRLSSSGPHSRFRPMTRIFDGRAARCAAAQPRRRHRGDSAVAAHRLSDRLFSGPQGRAGDARASCCCCSPSLPHQLHHSRRRLDRPSRPHRHRSTALLLAAGLIDAPLDWLLYSDFCGASRADHLLHAVHDLPAVAVDCAPSTGSISRQARCWVQSPVTTFLRITLPLVAARRVRRRRLRLRRLPWRKRRADHHGRRRL